ncbi:hypothetical protein XENOCAPTIV_026140, partial [Xenoophorus captivus]
EGIRPGDTTSTFCGTPNYIAPEILRGEDYGFSVDWWALGVLMFEMMAGRSPFDIITDNPDMNTEEYLFQVILEKPIRIPRSLSVKAASVLKGFLNKDPKERLGCQVQTGFTDIKSHTFFRSIDWDQVRTKSVRCWEVFFLLCLLLPKCEQSFYEKDLNEKQHYLQVHRNT